MLKVSKIGSANVGLESAYMHIYNIYYVFIH